MQADDRSAAWYARSIERAAARTGIECRIRRLPQLASRAQIKLGELSGDPAVQGGRARPVPCVLSRINDQIRVKSECGRRRSPRF